MLLERYWSHIQDCQDYIKRMFGCSVPIFSKIFKMCEVQHFVISKHNILWYEFGLSKVFSKYCGVPEIKYNWFCERWSRPLGPKTDGNDGFQFLLKWNRKVTHPKWSRIIIRSFRPTLLLISTIPPPPDPPNPESGFFPDFLTQHYRNRWQLHFPRLPHRSLENCIHSI